MNVNPNNKSQQNPEFLNFFKEVSMRNWVFVFITSLFLFACNDRITEEEEVVECYTNADCPAGYSCESFSKKCVFTDSDSSDGSGSQEPNDPYVPIPNTYYEVCDGIDNDADGLIDEVCECIVGETDPCGSSRGQCVPGVRICEPDGWSGCLGEVEPEAEVCDGLDNDCDGSTDENCECVNGSTKPCGFSVGTCKQGTQTCTYGQWGNCIGEITPTTESCDGQDNDCDGMTDEGCECFPGTTEPCGIDTGECSRGYRDCIAGFWSSTCHNEVVGTTESCDGLDNDCDGTADEGCDCIDGESRACGSDVGQCHAGVQLCVNGQWDACEGFLDPVPELCNGLDDDCDMDVDEDYAFQTDVNNCGACGNTCYLPHANFYCGSGQCRLENCNEGFYNFNADESDGCEYACFPTLNGEEACDYIDNDCNGVVDDTFDLNTDVNNCGRCNRACAFNNSAASCVFGNCILSECADGYIDLNDSNDDGCEYSCTISNNGEELCDNVDNDCDGSVDEGCDCLENDTRRCGNYEDTGLCHFGTQTCIGGHWSDCVGGNLPIAEVCNGYDDDCDYDIDEDFDFSSDINNCGACGVLCQYTNADALCNVGQCEMTDCHNGFHDFNFSDVDGCETACWPTNNAVEQCDDIDNDCDGVVDDGFDKMSDSQNCGSCNNVCHFTHAYAMCEAGTCLMTECYEGFTDLNNNPADGCEYICTRTVDIETVSNCDLLDNDCDGSVDEGCECVNGEVRYCGFNVGECHMGQQTCIEGVWSECNDTDIPQPEICDGNDNDCDGVIDNGFNFFTDVNNCGECGVVCEFDHAAASCVEGVCQMGTCQDGYYDIDNDFSTGCEYACFPTLGGIEACDDIDNDCDGFIDEDFEFESDLYNCGICGHYCHYYRALAECRGGECYHVGCEPDAFDLNQQSTDGCEYHCELTEEEETTCDGLDNDCDGTIDDGCECIADPDNPNYDWPRVCGSNVGECRFGQQDCVDGAWGDCVGQQIPMPEVCDELDNDCDGLVDEDFNLLVDVQNCGQCNNVCEYENAQPHCMNGECSFSCDAGFQDLNDDYEDGCEYACFVTLNGVEACDDIDNDCDGLVDEDFDFESDLYNCGYCGHYCHYYQAVAECVNAECRQIGCHDGWVDLNQDPVDGCEYVCTYTNDAVEICDGLDNNCDGQVDEVCDCQTGDQQVCGQNNIGQCKYGIQTCIDGFWSECVGNADPSEEVCDTLDNDCDGFVDEDFDLTSDINHCGECGLVCAFNNAQAACVDGLCVMGNCDENYFDFVNGPDDGCETVCADTNAGVEACDHIDNDCDGEVDEDFDLNIDLNHCRICNNACSYLHAGASCVDGQCQMTDCSTGWVDLNGSDLDGCEYSCLATVDVEVSDQLLCDGVDNDCDGSVDEGCECVLGQDPISCGTNVGECHFGRQVCQNDGTWSVCSGGDDPLPEVCDNLDNDCDGFADEDFDLLNDINHCGVCGNVCFYSNAQAFCIDGVCSMGACDQYYFDFNNSPVDGCETLCILTNAGIEQCDGIDNDCDGEVDEDFDLLNSPFNCGSCSNACNFWNAVATCVDGECALDACLDGWVDLNGQLADGCEYNCIFTGDEVCDGSDNNCDGSVDEGCDCINGDTIPCGTEEGVCESGVQTCLDGHWTVCQGEITPQPDVCDYLDNDCDGSVDEDFNLQTDTQNCGICGLVCQAANSTPVCASGVCQILNCDNGFYDLNNDERDGCEYACFVTHSGQEICDYADNDCDGEVDEDIDMMSDVFNCGSCGNMCLLSHADPVCDRGECEIDSCRLGWVDLNLDVADGCEYSCLQTVDNESSPECDGLDNDCDGTVDEGCLCINDSVRACGTDEGVCELGVQTCVLGQWSDCEDAIIAQPEACDGLDNDCDGSIDEDYNFVTDVNNCGMCDNVCKFANAFASCVNSSCVMGMCNSGFYDYNSDDSDGCEYPCFATNSGVEACDGIDNDCDGLVDEDYNFEVDVDHCGVCGNACEFEHAVAQCQNFQCVMLSCNTGWVDLNGDDTDGCEYSCTATVAIESNTECNALDDDCDGAIDEGCDCVDNDTRDCGLDTGDCEPGTQTCTDGVWGACVGSIGSRPEVCDWHDNDCDALIDENFNLQVDINNCGDCGIVCEFVNAATLCVSGICEMGLCDLGYYDLNSSDVDGCEYGCFTTNGGIEACDSIDNDCDGQIDETFDLLSDPNNCGWCGNVCNFPHASSGCSAGMCELISCDADWVDLNVSVLDGCEYSCTQTEVDETTAHCDGVDNDCDGSTDEGCACLENDTMSCGTDEGVCEQGVQTCVSGQWSTCQGQTVAEPEICDSLDNDCDGSVDEDFDLQTDVSNCGSCNNVCTAANATSSCVNSNCTYTCLPGFQDMNGFISDGCEYGCFITNSGIEACDGIDNDCDGSTDETFDLMTDVLNCGSCGNDCSFEHALADCVNGQCEIAQCLIGWVDLNDNDADGCEYSCTQTVAVETNSHCDDIDNDCDGTVDEGCSCLDGETRDCASDVGDCEFGTQTCTNGAWGDCLGAVTSQPEVCDWDDNDCDGLIDEDFNFSTDVNNCGDCGNVCEYPNAAAFCVNGSCNMGSCDFGYYDLNGSDVDGCEYACFTTNGGVEACDNVDNDCDDLVDETFDLQTDVNNCGWCGNVCSFPHSISSCFAGVCQLSVCDAGWVDLNNDVLDGCEYSCTETNDGVEICDALDNNCDGSTDEGCNCTDGDTMPCGTDEGVCVQGIQTCTNGQWSVCVGEEIAQPEICDSLDNDCDGFVDEDYNLMSDTANCGFCGNVCQFANADALCVNGLCQLGSCNPGFYNYNTNPSDGCEISCFLTNGGVETCDNIDNDCDGSVDETFDLTSDVFNCGTCNNFCGFDHATAGCQNRQCVLLSCNVGWVDLNNNDADGCEYSCTVTVGVETNTHCDDVDNDCDGTVDEGCSCLDGEVRDCGIDTGDCEFGTQTCTNGAWGDCIGAVTSQPEVCDWDDNDCDGLVDENFDFSTDVNNCGACGNACMFIHADAQCVNGGCVMGVCDAGYYDINGSDADGCEYACFVSNVGVEACDNLDNDCDGQFDEGIDLMSDPNNCGWCGHVCSFSHSTSSCDAGLCELSGCDTGWVDLNGNVLDGCEYNCTATVGTETTADCDGFDNDCDGSIDEGCNCVDGQVMNCGDNTGLCDYGIQTCVNGAWAACVGGTGPAAEICDSFDNDCDGLTDEGYDLQTDVDNCGSCGNGCLYDQADASCINGGCVMEACHGGYYDLNIDDSDGCEYECWSTNGGAEACDGIDNDCDGSIDEDFNLNNNVNHCGACNNACSYWNAISDCSDGVCEMTQCQSNWWDLNINDSDGCEYYCVLTNSGIEDCDGVDNNCDGTVDEGCSCLNGEQRYCGNDVGECHFGIQDCVNGVWDVCIDGDNPAPEICDNNDNDCDGSIDEDFNLQTDLNNCGSCGNVCSFDFAQELCVAGVCTMGACQAGFYDMNLDDSDGCEYSCFPTNGGQEQCDGIDNDCDGVVDEGGVCGP